MPPGPSHTRGPAHLAWTPPTAHTGAASLAPLLLVFQSVAAQEPLLWPRQAGTVVQLCLTAWPLPVPQPTPSLTNPLQQQRSLPFC